MKALVKSKAEQGLWLEDVPEPTISINDVLIRIKRTGICGTDVRIWNWDKWADEHDQSADDTRARIGWRDRRGRVEC